MNEELLNSDNISSSEANNSSFFMKRKRGSNYTPEELQCLVTEYSYRSNIMSFGSKQQKQQCWEEITFEVNKTRPEFCRSIVEIKKKWIDLLYDTRKQYNKASSEAVGGKRRRLSNVAEKIIELKGGFCYIPNKIKNGTKVPNIEIPCFEMDNSQSESSFVPKSNMGNLKDNRYKGQFSSFIMNHFESCVKPVPSELMAEFIRLKEESNNLKKRELQIKEENTMDIKQMRGEKKMVFQLQKQKLDLEIKNLGTSATLRDIKNCSSED